MRRAHCIKVSMVAPLALALIPGVATAQVSLQARTEIGRVEHRVRAAGIVESSSGTLFSGAVGLVAADQFEVWAEASGGRMAAHSPQDEGRNVAEVQVLAGASVRPWLILQGGATVRSYYTQVARQRWTILRLGAEASVPLAVDGIRGIVRGHWMPAVSVSGLPGPDVALTAAAGVEWRGTRVGVSVLYALERYDFAASPGPARLEEFSSLRLRGTVQLRGGRATGRI